MSGLYTQGPVQSEQDTTMRDLLAVIFKRKWLILLFFAVTSLIVGVKVLRTPETWSADATLMLQRNSRSSSLETTARPMPWVEVMESEVEIAKSVPVLQVAQAKLKQPSERYPEGLDIGMGHLNSMVTAGYVGESNVIYITSTASTGPEAVYVANTVAKAYEEYHRKLFALPNASGVIRGQADSTLAVLTQLQKRREQLLVGVGVSDLAAEEQNLQHLRYQLRNAISDGERAVSGLRAEYESIPTDFRPGEDSLPFSTTMGIAEGQALANAVQAYRKKLSEVEQLRSRYTEAHPQVQKARSEVQQLGQDLRLSLRQVADLKGAELRVAEAELQDLRRQRREVETRLAALPSLMQEVEVLDTQISTTERQYSSLAEKAVDSQVSQASFKDYGVSLLSPAVSPYRNARGDMVRVALAPLLSLLAGIGLAFYLENLDHSMKNREDVERHLQIPVLASFPDVDEAGSGLEKESRRTPFGGRRPG